MLDSTIIVGQSVIETEKSFPGLPKSKTWDASRQPGKEYMDDATVTPYLLMCVITPRALVMAE